ncbi:Prefoldin alpha subunit [Metschnikowia bicuspidata var. bicuspidata NRRL YB-4993]|uniref:Prefoldin alpha subunit n=1 Tax=Metschnikowia bicuspidata var. bicuspidata NRRL YB-4993 TaxID=869754 RepID=A0A1A0HB27_9ASCO|nr:Prefoldin alpha subunit [Metschnikowia bicuspidata var. bicuspidata NRRL YB-4993]OBA21093.1 Prefoldin alpha subunit [Metschnikowia bicuspidata var. bicuspidata NRRL YB-4993]
MSQRRIDLSQLEPQQIVEIRKSTEEEIQHFTQSLKALQTAQLKLQDCISTIDNMDSTDNSALLVPMTSSLYLPGKIKDKGTYLVDIGTGYFAEKSSSEAKLVYQKKHTKLEGDSRKLKEILVQKNEIMNQINMVLRKIMMEQDQAAEKQ